MILITITKDVYIMSPFDSTKDYFLLSLAFGDIRLLQYYYNEVL